MIGHRLQLVALTLAALLASGAIAQDLPDPAQRRVDPETEAAIRRGLDYLKSTQKPSGAWEASFGEATSVTSLAVMAYLACAHLPGMDGPYRDAIDRGIRFVVASQKPNGLLVASSSHGPMYCHGISTLMLGEVVGMMPDEAQASAVRAALGRAVSLILQAQAVSKGNDQAGGWRYQPTSTDSDLSVTGWQVMALRAARNAGMPVGAEPIDRAIAYVKRCATADGGFAYQPGGSANNPRTGVGILALELCGAHLSPEAVAGGAYLAENPPGWSSPYFFYEVYYCTQALFQLGDTPFRPYYDRLVAILLQHQDDNGSWLSGDSNDRTGGRAYCTAMAILALAVEYRYLPIYQR